MRLIKYASIDGIYIFPPQSSLTHNFGNLLTRTERRYLQDGAFNEYLGAVNPQASGNLQVGVWLIGADGGTISLLKREFYAMAAWLDARLWIQPELPRAGKLWCGVSVSNIGGNENVNNLPHLKQKIEQSFSVPFPAFQGSVSAPWRLDQGIKLDSGYTLDGARYLDEGHKLDGTWHLNAPMLNTNVIGTATVELQNQGNHAVYPNITLSARGSDWVIGDGVIIGQDPPLYFGGGAPVQNVTVTHRARGRDQSGFTFDLPLQSNDSVTINAAKQTVTLHNADGITEMAYKHLSNKRGFPFPKFIPGTNELVISTDADDCGVNVVVDYQPAWYNP